jgi:hypothetical protein
MRGGGLRVLKKQRARHARESRDTFKKVADSSCLSISQSNLTAKILKATDGKSSFFSDLLHMVK